MRYIFHRPSDHLTAVLDKHRMTGHRQCRAVLLRDVHHLTTNTISSQSLSASHSISLTRHQHVLPTPPLHYVTHGHPLPSHLPLLVLTPSLYVTHPSLCYSITLYDTHASLCYLTLPSSPPHHMSPHVPLLPTPPYVTEPVCITHPSLCHPPIPVLSAPCQSPAFLQLQPLACLRLLVQHLLQLREQLVLLLLQLLHLPLQLRHLADTATTTQRDRPSNSRNIGCAAGAPFGEHTAKCGISRWTLLSDTAD